MKKFWKFELWKTKDLNDSFKDTWDIANEQSYLSGMAEVVQNSELSGYFDEENNRYITGNGIILRSIHEKTDDCDVSCLIHNPSNHNLRHLKTHWRSPAEPFGMHKHGLMERTCEHGTGHPDPDNIAFFRRKYGDDFADAETVHGCCGCCLTNEKITNILKQKQYYESEEFNIARLEYIDAMLEDNDENEETCTHVIIETGRCVACGEIDESE